MNGRFSLRTFVTVGLLALASSVQGRDLEVVVVLGAAGTEEYGKKFQTQVEAWKAAGAKGEAPVEIISGEGSAASLEKRLASANAAHALWLVLIGHGTFDGREAKFNTEGPDIDAKQLADWLAPLKQEIVVVHTASASGGFLRPLAAKGRVIITATKSPDEVFYARFGEYFAEAIGGLEEADLDQDKQVSLLEAFRHASKEAALFYENDSRLPTEHALLDDNGDGMGTRRQVFEGAAKAAEGSKPDGERAGQLVLVLSEDEKKLTDAQRQKRDALELTLKKLREQRAKLGEDAYYAELEKLLRELSAVYGSSRPAT